MRAFELAIVAKSETGLPIIFGGVRDRRLLLEVLARSIEAADGRARRGDAITRISAHSEARILRRILADVTGNFSPSKLM